MTIPSFLSLRFSIPAIIILMALVVIPLGLLVIAPVIEDEHDKGIKKEAFHVINRLQSTLEYMSRNGDSEGIRREILLNASPDHVDKLMLFDENYRVIQSSDPEDIGFVLTELSSVHINADLLARARKTGKIVSFFNREEGTLYSSAVLNLFGDENSDIRPRSQGILILELNTHRAHAAAWKELEFLVASLALAVFVLAAALMWALNRMVTSRAKYLVECTQAFSEGDFSAFTDFKGQDELGLLGKAFDRMANRLGGMYAQLETNASLLDELLKNSPSMIVIRDTEGRFLRANPPYLEFVGIKKHSDITGKVVTDVLPLEIARQAQIDDLTVLKSRKHLHTEMNIDLNDHQYAVMSTRFPLYNDRDEIYAVCTILTDISDRIEKEKELRLARYIFETTNDGIIITDAKNRIVDANPSFETVTGYSRDEVLGMAPNVLNSHKQGATFYEDMWLSLEKMGVWSGEIWNRKKTGEVYPEWLTIKVIEDAKENVTGYFGVFTDISEHKKTEDSLRSLAYYDPLTNLANRTLCQDRLAHDMDMALRHGESLALVFIDLDFFKHINDSLGHEYGDRLLCEAASRIEDQVRSSDTVVRWGGDEFIIILPGIFQENMALVIANNVRSALKKPFHLKGSDHYVGASIGIAVYPNDAEDAESLIKYADAAMYNAKRKGRDQICFFDPTSNQRNLEQIQIKSDLHNAIENSEFELYYQPKVSLSDHSIIGLEALIRWNSANGGQISPAEFIPIAEKSGLIVPIGGWVFAEVCEQINHWSDLDLLKQRRVSVNLSPRQLLDSTLLKQIKNQLEGDGSIENYLSVEITETALIENIEASLPVLKAIRQLGIEVELDDFGSGYSSLNYLRRLPVDALKVDKSFISELEESSADQAIMEGILTMAHSLGIRVVAEGIETSAQMQLLTTMGCEIAQGYYFAKPMPAAEVEVLLREGISVGE